MVKVSVIVPVYNTQKYLDKCLKSLSKQTLKDIEVIVVNDGSPDNSKKIISKYTNKYPNFKCYIKENGGQASARNLGLKKAKGEYIGFVDSDDYVELDMFEKLYYKAKQGNFDVVSCDINYISYNNYLFFLANYIYFRISKGNKFGSKCGSNRKYFSSKYCYRIHI